MAQPRTPDFSAAVREAICSALGATAIQVRPFADGGNQRTVLISDGTQEWVARFERAGGRQLERMFLAQSLARTAGARAAKPVAWDLEAAGPDTFLWMVEERVPGVPFNQQHYDPDALRAIAEDTGAQFRLTHSASVEKWGEILPNPDPGPPTFQAMMERWLPGVERTLHVAGIGLHWLPLIREVTSLLCDSAPGTPCLCHGDPAGHNVLVSPSRTVTLIDWEWARGSDPAENLAYWSFWHDEPALLEALLTGYQPESPVVFRQRVVAWQVWTAISTIDVYAETPDPDDPTQGLYADPEGVAFAGQKLEGYLRERAWEK
jgi:aminoglycoside phosphotransferase (APT) family kinase protein